MKNKNPYRAGAGAILAVLAVLFILAFTNSQYVQIPLPTDTTPPLGHGRERLPMPSNDSYRTEKPKGEPATVSTFVFLNKEIEKVELSFRYIDNTVVGEFSSIAQLDGETVATREDSKRSAASFSVPTADSQITGIALDRDTITQTIIDPASKTITVRSLHGKTAIAVSVSDSVGSERYTVKLKDGQEITLPACAEAGEGAPRLTALEIEKRVTQTNFVEAAKTSALLQRLRSSSRKADRKIYERAEKTAAALLHSRGN